MLKNFYYQTKQTTTKKLHKNHIHKEKYICLSFSNTDDITKYFLIALENLDHQTIRLLSMVSSLN